MRKKIEDNMPEDRGSKMPASGKAARKGKAPLGDADPKVTSIQDMYLSPKRQCTAMSLQPGDVIVVDDECPVVLGSISRKHGRIRVWGKFIRQTERELHWKVGTFGYTQRLARAVPGEYRTPAHPTDTNL